MLKIIKLIALFTALPLYVCCATLAPIKKRVTDLGYAIKKLLKVPQSWQPAGE
ncbi:MAG: hypothetical protein ACI9OI_000633 [Chitinophagales bacterium]|jgi:uncharacterized membrane protein YraQ (UPF0718 family)